MLRTFLVSSLAVLLACSGDAEGPPSGDPADAAGAGGFPCDASTGEGGAGGAGGDGAGGVPPTVLYCFPNVCAEQGAADGEPCQLFRDPTKPAGICFGAACCAEGP